MGGTHFLQTGYLLLNRNAPSIAEKTTPPVVVVPAPSVTLL